MGFATACPSPSWCRWTRCVRLVLKKLAGCPLYPSSKRPAPWLDIDGEGPNAFHGVNRVVTSSKLIESLQRITEQYGDLPVLHGTTVGRDLMAADVDLVWVMTATQGIPMGMQAGQHYILLVMGR